MFSGLVQQQGLLKRRETVAGGCRLQIELQDAPGWTLQEGESIAVNGVCLTASQITPAGFGCEVLDETLQRTTLGKIPVGMRLNLERALRVGDLIGGHFVTGHIDGIGKVQRIDSVGRDYCLWIGCAQELLLGMVHKGSIALDGVSLTIAALEADCFSVHIIPYTWTQTSLGALHPGMAVNLETDILGKHVRRCLAASNSRNRLTWERLRQAGFGDV